MSINVKALASVTSTCYLGVVIDQHMTWKLHVANVLKRIRSKLCALHYLRPLQVICFFNCIKLLFYQYLIIMMLFGHQL